MFEIQFDKMKAKMNESEKVARETVQALEIELEEMNKELTALKLRNANPMGDLPNSDNFSHEIIVKRLE